MQSIGELISIMLTKSEKLEEEMKEKSALKKLTQKQLNCIESIREIHNPSLSELASELKITKPSTTDMVDRLIGKGYITRVKSDSDRRSALLHLTEKGMTASKLHNKVHKAFADKLMKNLTDSEKEILHVLLNKAISSL
jgi:DNA-binding MarR family transcriptional regulator